MAKTKIEYVDAVCNATSGCTPVSEGCEHCWAKRMAQRLRGRYGYPKRNPFKVTLHRERLKDLRDWKKPRRIFLCSMGDLFHEEVPDAYIDEVLTKAIACPQHTFLVFTKRAEELYRWWRVHLMLGKGRFWPLAEKWPLPNIHLYVSCENQRWLDERVHWLLQIPAAVHGVSLEPLLGPVDLERYLGNRCPKFGKPGYNNCQCPICRGVEKQTVDSVLLGGESGPGARPMNPEWVRSVRDQCVAAGVPFYFKSWGAWLPGHLRPNGKYVTLQGGYRFPHGKMVWPKVVWPSGRQVKYHDWPDGTRSFKIGKKAAGRLVDGQEWNELP